MSNQVPEPARRTLTLSPGGFCDTTCHKVFAHAFRRKPAGQYVPVWGESSPSQGGSSCRKLFARAISSPIDAATRSRSIDTASYRLSPNNWTSATLLEAAGDEVSVPCTRAVSPQPATGLQRESKSSTAIIQSAVLPRCQTSAAPFRFCRGFVDVSLESSRGKALGPL